MPLSTYNPPSLVFHQILFSKATWAGVLCAPFPYSPLATSSGLVAQVVAVVLAASVNASILFHNMVWHSKNLSLEKENNAF